MILIGPQKVLRNDSPRSRWSNRENGVLNYKLLGQGPLPTPVVPYHLILLYLRCDKPAKKFQRRAVEAMVTKI